MADNDSKNTCRYTLEEINSMPPLGLRPVDNVGVGSQNDKDKMTASNFPVTSFTIGSWKRESTRKGDLTAKIYYTKKKLLWEFLNGPLKIKMEVCWSDITAIEAATNPNQPGFLRVELAKPPLFFREIPPQQRKQTKWEPVDDFTGGQAQLCRRHEATFPPGVLDKHYEKLLVHDGRLAVLSRRLFPARESVFPSQQIPQQQQFHSLHIAASARGNQINNEPTCVGSSSRNPIVVSDQQQKLHHSPYKAPSASSNGAMAAWGNQIYNKPTFVGSSSQNPLVINNEPRFMGSSSIVRDQRLYQYNDKAVYNQPTFVASSSIVRDQRGYQYNDMALNNQPTFVASSSQNPFAVPASTFVGSSRQNRPLVIRDQPLYQYNDMTAPFIPPPSSCPPKLQHGLVEVEYSDPGEQALADAIVREANETCDALAWSLIELFGGGNVNEASSTSPAPPTGP